MEDSPFEIKKIIVVVIFASAIILLIFLLSIMDSRTKIVFCDVGQGDAAYIRIKNTYDILIDAGPDRKILDCLGRHMPFFDRKIELVIISHPDKDHVGGFLNLVNRFKFERIYSVPVTAKTQTYAQFKKIIATKHIKIIEPDQGKIIKVLKDYIVFYWPEKTTKSNLADINELSLVFLFKENDFSTLFTGDIPMPILERLLERYDKEVTILKIPHHGSKYNLSKKIISLADPGIGVISCGINNSYGHPAKTVIDMLEAAKINIRRTDKEGDIIFKLPN